VRVRGPETAARYEELRRVVDAHCPVFDLFTRAAPVTVELTKA
jgi:putative redox protein